MWNFQDDGYSEDSDHVKILQLERQVEELEARNTKLVDMLRQWIKWLTKTPEGRAVPQVDGNPGTLLRVSSILLRHNRKPGKPI